MSSIFKKISVKDILVGATFTITLLWAILWPVKQTLSVEVEYASATPGIKAQLFWEDTGGGFSEANSLVCDVVEGKANFDFGKGFSEISSLRIDPSNTADAFSLRAIRYYINDTVVASYGCDAIGKYFAFNNASYTINAEEKVINVSPKNNDVAMQTNSGEITSVLNDNADKMKSDIVTNRIAWCTIFFIIALILVHHFESLLEYFERLYTEQNSWFNVLAVLGMLLAAIGVWVIAFNSELGRHPDEWDVVECLKYGMTHWFPPDVRDAEVANTFSGYGYTKLENGTYYFLIAGKIAWLAEWLFSNVNWYRVPNVLLFLALTYLYCKNIKKKNWLILSCGICVQAWYIFSYTTADALDFFLAFLVLQQITDENSMLSRTVQLSVGVKNLFRCCALGVLFGMIFLGKPAYWAVLLLTFVVLLFKLIDEQKDKKKVLLTNYAIIVGFFCLTIITRYGFDLYHYGFDGEKVKYELEVQYAAYDRNPTTPLEEWAPSAAMYENGKEFYELFEVCPKWFESTYKSFCGLLADVETTDVYYICIGILYVFVCSCLAYFNLNKDTLIRRKIEFGVYSAIAVLSLVVSVLNSYFYDCQAQGRYLLPMLITMGYIGYKTPEAFEKKYFCGAVIALNLLSVWYFVTRALELVTI